MAVIVSRLQIRNFRSCKDATLDLARYTALIGRNNCGKSNCLSALQWLVQKKTLGVGDFNNPEQAVEVEGLLTGVTEEDLNTLDDKHRTKIAPFVQGQTLQIRQVQGPQDKGPSLLIRDANGEWKANPTGIPEAVKALLPDVIRIAAMDDAEEDASKAKTTTTIGKLLADMLEPIKARHEADLVPHLEQLEARLGASGMLRFEEFGRIDESINAKIADLFPGISIRLDFAVPSLQDIIRGGTVRVHEGDGAGRPFGYYGHGAQRAIQMALVRHLAELRRGTNDAGGATLLLVDEPELYMHPFAVEQVREALRQLSQSGYQVVFSTHSAQMVASHDARNALLMTKTAAEGTKVRPRMESVIQELVADPTHQLAQMFSLTNAAQVLFADKVVLTEGKTELRLLPFIFHKITGRTLGQTSLALVAQTGMNDTPKSLEILDALGLPGCAIVDLDFAFRAAPSNGLLDPADPDLAACKAILAVMQAEGAILLDPGNGLPVSKLAPVPSAKAFELLAARPEALPHITALVEKLRARRVWLWPGGAIEAHLGLASKKEADWLAFQVDCETKGVDAVCADAASVRRLVQWMQE